MMNRLQKQILKEALEYPQYLTEWEYDRVQEWSELPDDYEFSDKQNKIINRIGSKIQ